MLLIEQVLKFFFLAGTKREGIVEKKICHRWNTDHYININKDIPSCFDRMPFFTYISC